MPIPRCPATLLLLLLLAVLAGASNWTYNPCDGEEGPEGWPGVCHNQSKGSPIDVCGGMPFNCDPPVLEVQGYNTSRSMKIMDNGHTIQVNVMDNAPTLQVGNLSAIVGRGSNASTHLWVLEQMHLHWGRLDHNDEGSEHYLQDKRYPMEAHLVHYNALYGSSVQAMVDAQKPDGLLVIGVLFELGKEDPDLIKQMAARVPELTQAKVPMNVSVNFDGIFDGTGAYYAYPGSLTTPPCSEYNTWVVMEARRTVTAETLEKIKHASAHPPPTTAARKFQPQSVVEQYIDGDFRPLQPLNGRTVYYSGGQTAACKIPSEPSYECPSAASITMPLLALHFALLASVVLFLM